MSYHKPKYRFISALYPTPIEELRATRTGKGLFNHTLPIIVIIVWGVFITLFLFAMVGLALLTHSLGGWSGSTYTRAEQACSEVLRDKLYQSNMLNPKDKNSGFYLDKKMDFKAITKELSTDEAMTIADGDPFHHNTRITNLYFDTVPFTITQGTARYSHTITCVVDMNAANSVHVEMDPAINLSVKID